MDDKMSWKDKGLYGLVLAVFAGFFIWMESDERKEEKRRKQTDVERNELYIAIGTVSACQSLVNDGLDRYADKPEYLQESYDLLVMALATLNAPRDQRVIDFRLRYQIPQAQTVARLIIPAFDNALSTH